MRPEQPHPPLLHESRPQQALKATRKALEAHPQNMHALSNMVRLLVFMGEESQAREWAERLKAWRAPGLDVWTKKAEGLSYLGDDEGVLAMPGQAARRGVGVSVAVLVAG